MFIPNIEKLWRKQNMKQDQNISLQINININYKCSIYIFLLHDTTHFCICLTNFFVCYFSFISFFFLHSTAINLSRRKNREWTERNETKPELFFCSIIYCLFFGKNMTSEIKRRFEHIFKMQRNGKMETPGFSKWIMRFYLKHKILT